MNKNLITQLLVAYGMYKLYEFSKGKTFEEIGSELSKAVGATQNSENSFDLQKLLPIAVCLFGAQKLIQ